MASTKMLATAIAALAAVLMLTATATAQSTSCANNLIPCAAYLNSTKPPASCCDPLKETVTKELSCLCNLYKNPEVLKSLGVNITQALELPKHCGISNDVSACNKGNTNSNGNLFTPTFHSSQDNSSDLLAQIVCICLFASSPTAATTTPPSVPPPPSFHGGISELQLELRVLFAEQCTVVLVNSDMNLAYI
nr:lipid transfer-like protein VAS [Ipomoea batatas]